MAFFLPRSCLRELCFPELPVLFSSMHGIGKMPLIRLITASSLAGRENLHLLEGEEVENFNRQQLQAQPHTIKMWKLSKKSLLMLSHMQQLKSQKMKISDLNL